MTAPRSWRDVPMPTAVASLPRDKRGFPVPWVSEWEPSDPEINMLHWQHPAGAAVTAPFADCSCEIGVGEPDLGGLCTKRQIKGMLERLCDVCGEFIPAGPIYFIGGPMTNGFRECGLHYECALYSAQVCPGITTKPNWSIYEARAYMLRPEYKYQRGGEVVDGVFDSMTDPRVAIINQTSNMLLMCVYAEPIKAVATNVREWVAAQLKEHVA